MRKKTYLKKNFLMFICLSFIFVSSSIAYSEGASSNKYSVFSSKSYESYNLSSYEKFSTSSYNTYSSLSYETFSSEVYSYFNDSSYEIFNMDSYVLFTTVLSVNDYNRCRLVTDNGDYLNLSKIFKNVGIGGGIILVTGIILPAAFPGAVPCTALIITKLTSEALIGAAIDAAAQGIITYVKTNDFQKAIYKSIEGSSEGFKWGAICASGTEFIKSIKITKETIDVTNTIKRVQTKKTILNPVSAKYYEPVSLTKFTEAKELCRKLDNNSLFFIFEKYGDDAVDVVNYCNEYGVSLIEKYGNSILYAYKKTGNQGLELIKRCGVHREIKTINALTSSYSDDIIKSTNIALKKVNNGDLKKIIDLSDSFGAKCSAILRKNNYIIPDKITPQIIRDAKDTKILRDYIDELVDSGEQFTDETMTKLKPKCLYRSGEGRFYYRTDELGRIVEAETPELHLKNFYGREERLQNWTNTPDKLKNDQAGHIFGDRFGGSEKLDNL